VLGAVRGRRFRSPLAARRNKEPYVERRIA
jgi:hypothetical protein